MVCLFKTLTELEVMILYVNNALSNDRDRLGGGLPSKRHYSKEKAFHSLIVAG